MTECGFRSGTSRSHQQVDVCDLVAVADERLAYQDAVDLGHAVPPMSGMGTCRLTDTPPERSWSAIVWQRLMHGGIN
jgi:hypothetical protein